MTTEGLDVVACTMQYDPVCGIDGKNYSTGVISKPAANAYLEPVAVFDVSQRL